MNRLVTTEDGSHTVYVPELDEHYHSTNGAVQESEHIFINCGFDFCKADPLRILEVGFGTGLNALLTAVKSLSGIREVLYTSVEKYPVEDKLIRLLNHNQFAGEDGKVISDLIYSAPWGDMKKICRNFSINKILCDVVTDCIPGYYDLIYYDAFGPEKQPEMWSSTIFEKISAMTVSGGILLTYSSKGLVKRNLRSNGFKVKRLPGPPGKRHIIRAIKI
ncbi:MAG: tRNA (5-methylaminomethyl-2-thiouridine)(34)-methyltransferase MnmD [Bacteroidia bacterium]|nr:tRNA (5-methylaminomethyl-2-thiouridine)(34)-methyltransferase MnmD [Bacteroidia bacterium]